jgi:hypothetical protein
VVNSAPTDRLPDGPPAPVRRVTPSFSVYSARALTPGMRGSAHTEHHPRSVERVIEGTGVP